MNEWMNGWMLRLLTQEPKAGQISFPTAWSSGTQSRLPTDASIEQTGVPRCRQT